MKYYLILISFASCILLHSSLQAQINCPANTMYAMDVQGTIFTIDLTTGASSPVCGPIVSGQLYTELEFIAGSDGDFMAQQSGVSFMADIIDDISSCSVSISGIMNGHTFTGLEYVGNVLYAAGIDERGGASSLYILDPLTGTSTLIGPLIDRPFSGIAYDVTSGIMYGVSGGGVDEFYAIDLTTGAVTLIGLTGVTFGSLAFSSDGLLIGGGAQADSGDIYLVDPTTGMATLIGDSGIGAPISGLTICPASTEPPITDIPTLGQWGLLSLGLLLTIFGVVSIKQVQKNTAV